MVGGSATGSGSHIGGKLERLEPDKRVWQGSQHTGQTKLSKLQTGALGEKIAMESLEAISRIDYGTLNVGLNNAPVDAAGDHEAIEIKTGIATNTPAAQQFRATIGQPGKEESARLLHMSAEEKRMYNQHKSQQILKRKSAMLGKMSRLAGQKVTPYTVAVILSPDGKRGDVFKVPGFHLRLGWNDSIVKDNYIGTYTVGR